MTTWKATLLIWAGLALAAPAAERELKIAPPAAGADAVPLLRDALQTCRAQKIQRLVLERGTWHLHPEKADGMFRHISNHDACYRRLALHLEGFTDFEIDGQGSTLLCHGVLTTVAVDNSSGVTLRNFTIEWDKPFHLEGTVTAVGTDFFEVEMLPECGVKLQNGRLYGGVAEGFFGELQDPGQARQDMQWNYWINPQTKAAAAIQPPWLKLWNPKTRSFAEVTEVATNRFRIRNAHANVLPEVGTVMVCKGMNRPNRLSPAVHFSSTDRVRVENITVHHAGGMGLIAEDCADVFVKNFRVALKEGARSLITTTADATHFVGCRGLVQVEDCLFENMLDDSCNVHGVYAIAEGLVAPDRLAVSFSHFQQLGTAFARPGDRLRLIKRDTLLGYADCRVTALTRHNEDYYVLTVDRPLAGVYQPDSSVENLSARPDVIYRHNTVRNNRARSLLMTAGGKVLVEDNLFERPSMMGILVEGDNEFWYESGGVEDLTIRSNKFIGLSTTAPLLRLAAHQPRAQGTQPPYHHNIRILANTIEAASPLVLMASRVQGLEFADNVIHYGPAVTNATAVAFQLKDCAEVAVRGNRFSRPAELRTTPPQAPVKLEQNENLRRP